MGETQSKGQNDGDRRGKLLICTLAMVDFSTAKCIPHHLIHHSCALMSSWTGHERVALDYTPEVFALLLC